MNLDLNQLRILVVLDEEKTMTKAAQRLFVSQSAASHNLAKLRDRFNDPLFVRTSQGMKPTPFAQQILPILREGIRNITRAADMQSSFCPQENAHTFYIGASDYFEFVTVPILVEQFLDKAPNIRLSIDIDSANIKRERLESGQLDAYIGVNVIDSAAKSLHCREWINDRYVAVVADWKDIPDTLTPVQFASQSQIHLPVSGMTLDVIDAWLHENNLYRNIHMITQSYPIGGMISSKTGLLFPVPEKVAKLLVTMAPLKIVELPDGIPPMSLSILTHKLFDHQPSIQWLVDEIIKVR